MRRETSSYERVMFYYSNLGPMFFGFRIHFTGKLEDDVLREALEKIRIEFPLSAVRVETHEDHRQFITTDNVPFYPLTFIRDYVEPWEKYYTDLIRLPFNAATGPMVRFSVLQNGTDNNLLAVFHHAVVDGVGASILLERLMAHLGDPSLSVTAPDEDSWAIMLHKHISDENMTQILSFDPPAYKDDKSYTQYTPKALRPAPFPNLDFKIHTHAFSKAQTDIIVQASHRHNVTVHALLGALMLSSFAEEFGPENGYKRIIQSPVNFRPQLRAGSDKLFGLYNGLVKATIDCTPGRPIPDIASEIGHALREQIDSLRPLSGYYNFMTYLLEGIDYPEEYYASRDSVDTMDYDFSFSNLGRVDIAEEYGPYHVDDVFGPTFSATKGERVIGAMTCHGRLFINMVYDSGCFDSIIGERIFASICRKITDNNLFLKTALD
ncbi:MAG: hypothetical protein GXY06_01280 [Clostridiaceae bacterium]|nr:hypothetical protein [Clostridiaceae bacterium]